MKNKSTSIKSGRIAQTDDTALRSGRDYKGKPTDKPNNRPVGVLATNNRDELAVVKITHSSKAIKLKNGVRGHKSGFRPYVETLDRYGKPLKANKQIRLTEPPEYLSKDDFRSMAQTCFRGSRNRTTSNRNRVRKMKGRKKLK